MTAIDDNGLESNGSNEVQTTVIDTTPPQSPTNLIYQIQNGTIILNWTAPNDFDLNYFFIYRTTTPIHNASLLNPIANTTTTSWIEPVLPPNKYYYTIVAVDFNGLRSDTLDFVSVTIAKPHSNTLLIILIIFVGCIGIVLGFAVYDRRRNPNSIFHKFNRRKLNGFFKWTEEKSIIGMKFLEKQVIHLGNYLKPKFNKFKMKMKSVFIEKERDTQKKFS